LARSIMLPAMVDDCLICVKHQHDGADILWRDELVVVSHLPPGDDGTALLGYLFVETRRHAATLADLTEPEAEAVGRMGRRAARALRAEIDTEYVLSAIVGRRVPHFHQHFFVRHPGTPEDVAWFDEWPDAPRGDAAAIAELCARLLPHLAQ